MIIAQVAASVTSTLERIRCPSFRCSSKPAASKWRGTSPSRGGCGAGLYFVFTASHRRGWTVLGGAVTVDGAPVLRVQVLGRVAVWHGDEQLSVGPPGQQA